MARLMKLCGGLFTLLTALFSVLYAFLEKGFLLTLAVTFGTFAYHLVMRLLVGGVFDALMKNRADYRRRWFRVCERETRLYERLGVKKWKGKMPTYDPTLFDPKKHSWGEIAEATCQAELVHETIVVLSFLPILASLWFDSFFVFLLTSLVSACFDAAFVVMQRYNRPRVIRLAERKKGA